LSAFATFFLSALGAAFLFVLLFRRRIPFAGLILPGLILAAVIAGELLVRSGWICVPLREKTWEICGSRDIPERCRGLVRESDELLPDCVWRVDLHTDLLGNQATRKSFVFRGREYERTKKGPRIVCLGTSSTFGAGLTVSEPPFPARIERALSARRPGWTGDVVNAGLTGMNSFVLMILQRDVLSYLDPDVMIYYYGGNEGPGIQPKLYYRRARGLVDAYPEGDPCERWLMLKFGTGRPAALALARVLDRSRLLDAVKPSLIRLARRRYTARLWAVRDQNPPPKSWDILFEMCRIAKKDGYRLLLVPEISAFGGAINEDYARLMRQAADDKVVFYKSFENIFPEPRARFFLDSAHMTAEGSRLLGEAIASFIEDWI